jgi:hypothetical protein
MDPIRTLGLYQPYAELMLHGKIETRWIRAGTKPPFPLGPYLLYACKADYPLQTLSQIAGEKQYKRITEIINGLKLVRGAALCTGDLVKIIYIVEGMEDETFVRYQGPMEFVSKHGTMVKKVRVGLIFENVRRIKPFPFKGKQGVGILSDIDMALIEYL